MTHPFYEYIFSHCFRSFILFLFRFISHPSSSLPFRTHTHHTKKMNKAAKKFIDFLERDDTANVLELISSNPNLNVNSIIAGVTLLGRACVKGNTQVVQSLLAHPHICVDQITNGDTAFSIVCSTSWCSSDMLKLFLDDHRVNIMHLDDLGYSPIYEVVVNIKYHFLRLMIASGRNFEKCPSLGKYNDRLAETSKSYEIASKYGENDMSKLIKSFIKNPYETRVRVRRELGVLGEAAADVFALMIFSCDELLQLRGRFDLYHHSIGDRTERFFKIAERLPMELQMILCCRAVGSSKDIILTKDSEPAFKKLARICELDFNILPYDPDDPDPGEGF